MLLASVLHETESGPGAHRKMGGIEEGRVLDLNYIS